LNGNRIGPGKRLSVQNRMIFGLPANRRLPSTLIQFHSPGIAFV